jgi:uncharacterized zinc-type alcohol dehydrogenase-like protein
MPTFHALAADAPKAALEPFEYDPGELAPDEVEIEVHSCGICHSDLSMRDNEWGITSFPFVPGHEVAGVVAAVGSAVTSRRVGDRVGLGWHAGSCMHCRQCLSGDHNLCPSGQGTIVGRHGGFADRVRCHETFAVPIPDAIGLSHAGPLFCGGITVFNPIVQFGVLPTDRVGVVGIGGLGHLALQFLRAWGCHVTAFTSTGAKADEARSLGAHEIINSRSDDEIQAAAGSFDFIISTVNVALNWDAYLGALSPRGRLHVVGAVLEPIPVPAFSLIMPQKSISGSPVGAPAAIATMLEFCARHGITPTIERFPMGEANAALAHLEAGRARYRIVLERDAA